MSAPNWFIAMPVPAETWLEALTPLPEAARRYHASDVHVTVAFLGQIDEDRAMAAWAVAERLPARGPFSFLPGRVRPFGGRRPTAWSVEPEDGAPALSEYIGAVRGELSAAAGVPADRRHPRPHATVARPLRDSSYDDQDAIDAWAGAQRLPPGPVILDRLALYTWSEHRGENLFRVVLERPL